MSAAPHAEIALLPLPRLRFERVRLTAGGREGPTLAEGGRLSLQLNLSALLFGRVEVATIALDHATITLPETDADHRWNGALGRLAELGVSATHPRRLALTDATVTGRDPRDGTPQRATAVDLAVSWPFMSAGLTVTGGLTWNGTSARISLAGLDPGALVAKRASPLAAIVTWPAGSCSLDGTLALAGPAAPTGGLSLSGEGSFRTQSLSRTLAWIGGDVALSPIVEDLAIEGRFEATGRSLALPSMHVETGGNRLDGAGSAVFGTHRTAVQATLAADDLNLSPLLGTLLRIAGLDGASDTAEGWAHGSLALGPLTGGDLDLRLSAGAARLGPIVLDELATSVIVREDGVETALGRAGFQGGTLKGRLVLATAKSTHGGRQPTEIRAQGAFENVDLGAVLIDVGQSRWLLGATQGTVNLEGTGTDVADLMRRVGGRMSLGIDGGSFTGFDLTDVIHRGGVLAVGPLARRNNRTPFERAAVSVQFTDGVGEITEGTLSARALTASLRGRIFLPHRSFEARAELLPRVASVSEAAARLGTLFEIGGPWESVAVRRLAPGEAPPSAAGGSPPPAARALTAPALPERARAYAP